MGIMGVRMNAWGAARWLAAGALLMSLCWQRVQSVRLGYRVEAARQEAARRGERVAALRLELDGKLSPARLASAAARLGLVPCDPSSLRTLPSAPARPAPSLLGLLGRTGFPLPVRG